MNESESTAWHEEQFFCALEYHPQKDPTFKAEDVTDVLCLVPGYHDTGDWVWVVQYNANVYNYNRPSYCIAVGGCDFTGWNCSSDLEVLEFYPPSDTPEKKWWEMMVAKHRPS